MVFKYFDTSREYARKSLEQIICFNKIWLSSFDDFNDPYECYPTFTDELTKSYLKNLNKIMRSADPKRLSGSYRTLAENSRRTSPTKIRKRLTKRSAQNLSESLKESALETFRKTGVACFSEDGRNSAMWAYYADSHRGIVLEFAKSLITGPVAYMLWHVNYSSERPKISLCKMSDALTSGGKLSHEIIAHFLFTKSLHWQHERELRIISKHHPNQYIELDTLKLARIILGIRTSEADMLLIKSLVGNQPIEIVRARLSQLSFDIET
jgi:hypothetical protein